MRALLQQARRLRQRAFWKAFNPRTRSAARARTGSANRMGAVAFSVVWVSVVESVGSLRCARTRSASVTFRRGREADPLAPVIPFVPLGLRAAVGFPRKPRSVFSGTGIRMSGGMGPAARVNPSPSRMRPAGT